MGLKLFFVLLGTLAIGQAAIINVGDLGVLVPDRFAEVLANLQWCQTSSDCRMFSNSLHECVAPDLPLPAGVLNLLKHCKPVKCDSDSECGLNICGNSEKALRCNNYKRCQCYGKNCTSTEDCSDYYCGIRQRQKPVCGLSDEISGQTCRCIWDHLQNCKDNSDCPTCTNTAFEPVCTTERDSLGPAYTCRCFEKDRCETRADCKNFCSIVKVHCCDTRSNPLRRTPHCICLNPASSFDAEEQCERVNSNLNLHFEG